MVSLRTASIGVVAVAMSFSSCSTYADTTEDSADRIAREISNSKAVTTAGVAWIASSNGADVLIAETGSPDSSRSPDDSTRLVLGLHGMERTLFAETELYVCWEYEFNGREQDGNEHRVDCPDTEPLDVPEAPEVTVPSLDPGSLDLVSKTADELVAGNVVTAAAVRAELEQAFTDQPAAVIDVTDEYSVIGASVGAGRSCVMVRFTDPPEVWVPQSADAFNENGLDGCHASAAARGDYQEPSS